MVGISSAVEALRDAGSLSQGRWWAVFEFLLAVTALTIAGAALLGLGLLIPFPVALRATSRLFRTLQRSSVSLLASAA